MRVRFRLLGSLRETGRSQVEVDVPEGSSLKVALDRLSDANPRLASAFSSPARNLILLDGVEAGNLQGPDTPLREGVEIAVIPVVHGG